MVPSKFETERLIIRKPRKKDWGDIVEGCNDLRVSRWVNGMSHPFGKKQALSWINRANGAWRKKEMLSYPFVIELKSESKVIGGIGIFGINKDSKKCRTGSWINVSYQRKGYITEAKVAINDFVFDELKLNRMETNVFTNNLASNAAQKKVGYRVEGKQVQSNVSKATGKLHDEFLYGLLKSDWKKSRKKVISNLSKKISYS